MRSFIKFPPYCVTSYLFVVDEDEDDDEDDGENEEKGDGEGRNVDEVSEEEQDLRDDEDGETILMKVSVSHKCVEESRLVGLWVVALFVGKAALIFRDMGRGWGCWGPMSFKITIPHS